MSLFRQLPITLVTLAVSSRAAQAAGIPQMDQTWYGNQLLWLAISFVLLYSMVSLFIAPTAAKILGVRAEAITSAVAQAEKAKHEAELARNSFEEGGQSARTKAAEMMASAQAANSRENAEALARLDKELAHSAGVSNARIANAQAKALNEIATATTELASAMASKLLGRPVSVDEASIATSPIVNLKKAS